MSKRQVSPWVVSQQARPEAAVRLLCFPYAGGGAMTFRKWPVLLPDFIQVCSLLPPGRETRMDERPFTSLDKIVEEARSAVRPLLDKKLVFFGHSMGAMIAFELARRLREEEMPEPLLLFVSGRRAPQLPSFDPSTYDLPDREFMVELHRLNGTPREVLEHSELMSLMLPLLRADFEVVQTYAFRPGPPLTYPIIGLRGIEDNEVSREDLQAWSEQTTAVFSLHTLPGDHFYLRTAEPMLLSIISHHIQRLVLNA